MPLEMSSPLIPYSNASFPSLPLPPPGRIPSLKADKRKGFIYNRSLSVLTWSICVLTVSEVISAYLRIPITSTLAFGGIGGLAIGLAGKVSRCARLSLAR